MKNKWILWTMSVVLLTTLTTMSAKSQISKVLIQASGLTCSMCSNSINKSLKTIPGVANIYANVKNSTFEISFQPNASIDFDLLKKKVEDAGFFVARFEIHLNLNDVMVEDEAHVELDNKLYHFMHVGSRKLNGTIALILLDKGFVTDKEFKRNAKFTAMGCYQTGYKGTCCSSKTNSSLKRIYHVTI